MKFTTKHNVQYADARDLPVATDSVELVVTSPPYPMIEMWDDLFQELNQEISGALTADDGDEAFELMHRVLDTVWENLYDVVVDGGVVCINIGDATRSIDGEFRVFRNAARITNAMEEIGFVSLPHVLWQKPTTSPNSFLGSGTVPPNAYVTNEHEYILVFRNGGKRTTFPSDELRAQSAMFFDERNTWFSDHWSNIPGRRQEFATMNETDGRGQEDDVHTDENRRDRTAAYPFEIPYRLINMYSVYTDRVLDPFGGVGTTALASMVSGRSSVTIELNDAVVQGLKNECQMVPELGDSIVEERLEKQEKNVSARRERGKESSYEMEQYPLDVVSSAEQKIEFVTPNDVRVSEDCDGGFSMHVSCEEFSGYFSTTLSRFAGCNGSSR